MKKKILFILGVIVIVICLAAFFITSRVRNFEAYMEQIAIVDVDLSKIDDGTYSGVSDSGVIKVKVEVIIKDQKIKDIKLLEHKNGKGKDAEAIIEDIIKQQKIKVDAISGATLSSLVIQDAIQKAVLY